MSARLSPGFGTEILLVRHAPTRGDGGLAGRRDLPCDLPGAEKLAAVRAAVGEPDRLWVSPARRCRATAAALFPESPAHEDPRLWEQDFGAWEGLPYAEIPDLGPLSGAALARHRPPGGESFADLCKRLRPALREAAGLRGRGGGRVAVVAHAGTVRGALALALGSPGRALAFEVAPLSVSMVRALPGGGWSVGYANRIP